MILNERISQMGGLPGEDSECAKRERGRTPILSLLSSPTTAITLPIYGFGVLIASRTVPPVLVKIGLQKVRTIASKLVIQVESLNQDLLVTASACSRPHYEKKFVLFTEPPIYNTDNQADDHKNNSDSSS